MKTLALELSSAQGSVAFREDEDEIFAAEFANDRKNSGTFFENLQSCLGRCGDPDRIVVGLGPGSYAGTRIAISAAIGLQVATGAELFGLESFRAMATNAVEYTAVGDARRQSFWFAEVRARKDVLAPTLCSEEELRERLAVILHPIFSAETLLAFPGISLAFPSAQILATITTDFIQPPLEPLYLRDPHITKPKIARV